MKKMLALLVVLTLVPFTAFAADMGVQIIPGPEMETEPVSLDDLKLEESAKIDGWGTITLTFCDFQDNLTQYNKGKHEVAGNWSRFESGVEADYMILKADILNSTRTERDYLANVEVKVIFDDDVEFAGWFWQYNWDNGVKNSDWGDLNGIQNKELVIDKADQFPIGPYYVGHYCFGCTLPNAIVNGEEPLRMEITIDGNKITYNYRQ